MRTTTGLEAHFDATPTLGQRLQHMISTAIANHRAHREDRRMRELLAELPDSQLLDIGIAHDEIVRIRAREYFKPRAWEDLRGRSRRSA